MRVVETPVEGLKVVKLNMFRDERGYFLMFFDRKEFEVLGFRPDRVAVSFNRHKLTLRGMHFQLPPYGEVKVVKCLEGAIWDVAIDLRRSSKTYRRWMAFLLWSENFAKDEEEAFGKVREIARKNGVEIDRESVFVCSPEDAVFIPEGFAHGFLTLAPRTKVVYLLSNEFAPSHYRGVRWNDPAFRVLWPAPPKVINERDRTYPDWDEQNINL